MTHKLEERSIEEKERREELEERHEEGLSTADLARAAEPRGQRKEDLAYGAEMPPLLNRDMTEDFRTRWDSIQTSFVDEPRDAVQKADALVAEVMKRLATIFSDERHNLESQWGEGKDVSTEDLRIALQKYRSFFSRLLSI